MAGNKRLTKELADLGNDPIEGCHVAPKEDDIYHWEAMCDGPAGTPYEGGVFNLDIAFPSEYPFKPPKVKFTTTIYHPNIKTDSGEICADIISNNWAPTLNVKYVLNAIKGILSEPNVDSPLEAEIAAEYTADKEKFNEKAKAHTQQYAT